MTHLPLRLTRLRRSATVRKMLQETHLRIEQFIAPLFIRADIDKNQAIRNMPDHYQLTLTGLAHELETIAALGVSAVLLFGIPAYKDPQGSAACLHDGIVQQAIRYIRQHYPQLLIIADLCLCEYTDHGHCGILDQQQIQNSETLVHLAQQAVSLADAGADWVAPSSMTDGMVHAIRQQLDLHGHHEVAILSYAVKYASHFYGPFRDAAQGAPKFGDRKSYQMNPANRQEGMREAMLDLQEGADILMVKPAMHYLDVIYAIKQQFPEVPLCAYQVSGEYAMLKSAAAQGIVEEQAAMIESLLAIKRAGSDLIISYFTKDLAKLLQHKEF